MRSGRLTFRITVVLFFSCRFGVATATAEDRTAIWASNPVSNLWRNPANWSTMQPPHTSRDRAKFGASNVTNVIVDPLQPGFGHSSNSLDKIVFTPDAPAYTLIFLPDPRLPEYWSLSGEGIINHSSAVQNVVVDSLVGNGYGEIDFVNNAAVSPNLIVKNRSGIKFFNTSSAGGATYINEGGTASLPYGGAFITYDNMTTAGATFINNPGEVAGATGGYTTLFSYNPGSVENSTFICNAATVPGAGAGYTDVEGGPVNGGTTYLAHGSGVAGAAAGQVFVEGGYGYATFIAEGGRANGADGALIMLDDILDPDGYTDQNIVMALGGVKGGAGGTIMIMNNRGFETSQFQVFGNALLDLISLTQDTTFIGSLAGDGQVDLAGHRIEVGGNNMDTTFAGAIKGDGTLTKVGTGTLGLTGISRSVGSVHLDDGTLGGNGVISGKLVIGTRMPGSATVAPAAGSGLPAVFTVGSSVNFDAFGAYTCLLSGTGDQIASDQITAKGVTIASGAQFSLLNQVQGTLTTGAIFTVINNIGPDPMNGTFANLPDGGTISVNGATLQASYEGGTGNDLTLTVQ